MKQGVWRTIRWVACLLCAGVPGIVHAQNAQQKEVRQRWQTWASINSVNRINQRWGVLGDFHVRRNDFLSAQGFYFFRAGFNYWVREHASVAFGYAHTWLAPPREDWKTWTHENRVYQQFVYRSAAGRTQFTQRLRNEQRWVQVAENDQRTGRTRFTNRFRYLASAQIRVFKKPPAPALVLSDEILLQFGKDIVYNTFDQNRLFIGLYQQINPHLGVDFGYMNVYQQRFTGYQYDMNHTIRLFFYLNTGYRRKAGDPSAGQRMTE